MSIAPARHLSGLTHHKFTVADYDKMIEIGILQENEKLELIRGEIVEKMSPIGDLHSSTVRSINEYFGELPKSLKRFIVLVQDPLRLKDSKPEPDIVLLKRADHRYRKVTPAAADVLLLIEVADSSLGYDRTVKKSLYAENGIPEYWIVNLCDRCIELFRQPLPDGTYAESRSLSFQDSVSLAALPKIEILIAEMLELQE